MFTGLVTNVGRLASAVRMGSGLRIAVEHGLPGGDLSLGESVNVDGCCLTVTAAAPGRFEAELSPETLAKSGGAVRWRSGRALNLERALAVGERLGGHVVQGHADGVVRLIGLRRAPGGWITARVALSADARRLVVPKGSVALDGVSLTVSALGGTWFEVALIPATLAATTWGRRRPGDRLVVEYDVMAKYAGRGAAGPAPAATR